MRTKTAVSCALALCASAAFAACSGSSSNSPETASSSGTSSGASSGASSGSGSSSGGHGSSSGTTSSSGASGSSSGTTSSSSGASGSSSGTSSSSSGSTSSSSGASSSSGSSSGGGTCGTCAGGFTCAPGGYCVSSKGVPAFEHVYLIVMENTSQSAIQGNSQAPYINSLMTTYAYTKNYSTSYHPSLPNYLDIVSGSNQGLSCDCDANASESKCGAICLGSCFCGNLTAQHIGDQLDGANISWRNYAESAGGACATTNNSGNHYATKHVPFLYFQDVTGNATTCADRVVDFTQFATDLAAPRRFNFISPNLCDDMHDSCTTGNIPQGDAWLKAQVPAILATPGFAAGGKDVLFIVWDEQTGSVGGAGTPMLLIAVGPLVKPGATSTQAYTHESLLATFEEAFGLSRLANAAQVPSPINDVWK